MPVGEEETEQADKKIEKQILGKEISTMTMRERAHKNAELITGMSVSELRNASPEKFRKHCEKQFGKSVRFTSEYPFVGHGNVLRDGIMTRDVLDSEVDKILEM